MFSIKYDYADDEEDAPQVYFVDSNGSEMLHVYEDPTFIGGEPFEESSWKLGPFVESVLRAIRVADSIGDIISHVETGTDSSLKDLLVSERVVGPPVDTFKFDIKGITQGFGARAEITRRTNNK